MEESVQRGPFTRPSARTRAKPTSRHAHGIGAHVEHLGFSAHSPRAGWATELRLKGVSFTKIKTQKRWSSDKSLLTYLDVSTTMRLQLQRASWQASRDGLRATSPAKIPWWGFYPYHHYHRPPPQCASDWRKMGVSAVAH